MNAQQRRKTWRRKLGASSLKGEPILIRHWGELANVPDSETHRLEIDVGDCCGWICRRDTPRVDDGGHYLSTHTFYGPNYQGSTLLLRRYGFNVTLDNWDKT